MSNEFKKTIEALGPEMAARLQQRHRDEIARLCAERADPEVGAWRIAMELRQDEACSRLALLGIADPAVFARAYALLAGGLEPEAAAEQAASGLAASDPVEPRSPEIQAPAPGRRLGPKA